ncbi:50S ribosomal protein L10 [Candidatus Daviesbacteria bacterium]|nr:50S ribosomal protein L10 [Candidatus Daviesbacteria bacterium]
MAKTRVQKEETVQSLTQKLEGAKSLVFADYRGLTTAQLSDTRKKLKEQSATLSVTKNTLLKRALENAQLKVVDQSVFEGPVATLFTTDDEISPIKTVVKALKDAGVGSIKAGFLGNEYLDQHKVISLSILPSKDELRAKTVGVLVAPLQGMVSVLNGNLKNLVYALDQLRLNRSQIENARGGETQ